MEEQAAELELLELAEIEQEITHQVRDVVMIATEQGVFLWCPQSEIEEANEGEDGSECSEPPASQSASASH